MKYCPQVKDICKGAECVRWDEAATCCMELSERQTFKSLNDTMSKYAAQMTAINQDILNLQKQNADIYSRSIRISLAVLRATPGLPEELKNELAKVSTLQEVEELLAKARLM